MFYIVAKKFDVSLHEGRAWIKYFGITSVRIEGMNMHCVSVDPFLRGQAEAEARKQETEYLQHLIEENEALKSELDDLKSERPAEQEAA